MKEIEIINIEDLLTSKEEKDLFKTLDKKKIEEFLNYTLEKSKHTIELISKLINRTKRKKFPDKNYKKYGNVSRGLSKEEVEKIINSEEKAKIRLCLKTAYKLGLRESEVVKIKTTDIQEDWKVKINNEKCNRIEYLIIPISLRPEIEEHIKKNKKIIKQKNNHLFYSENPVQKREHLSPKYLSKRFRELSIKLKINYSYGMSEEPEFDSRGKRRKPRKLYQFCLHSLRHSFGREYYKASNKDIVKTSQALRHRSLKTTMGYVFNNENEVFEILEGM